MASSDDPSQKQDCETRVIGLVEHLTGRAAGLVAALLWSAAVVCLILYAHSRILGPTDFSMVESWLIGLGCIGAPIVALRLLGRFLTPVTALCVAGMLTACAGMLTVLVVTGQIRVAPIVAIFALILPEAGAIHAVNAADSQVKIEQARRRGRLEGLALAEQAQLRRAEDLCVVKGMPREAVENLYRAVTAELAAAGLEVRSPLRLVHNAEDDAPTEEIARVYRTGIAASNMRTRPVRAIGTVSGHGTWRPEMNGHHVPGQ